MILKTLIISDVKNFSLKNQRKRVPATWHLMEKMQPDSQREN